MKIEITKRELGFIICALMRYVKRHEIFTKENMTMQALCLHFQELGEATQLYLRLDKLFTEKRGDNEDQTTIRNP